MKLLWILPALVLGTFPGNEPISRRHVVRMEDWNNRIMFIDLGLCPPRPWIFRGVEVYSQPTTLRLIVARGRREPGLAPVPPTPPDGATDSYVTALTGAINIEFEGSHRIELSEPLKLEVGDCIGWLQESPSIPCWKTENDTVVLMSSYKALPMTGEPQETSGSIPCSFSIRLLPEDGQAIGAMQSRHVAFAFHRPFVNKQDAGEEGVAVCLAGDPRNLEFTADRIDRMLVRPLRADLFIYGPKAKRKADQAALSWLMHRPYTKSVRIYAENVTQTLRSLPEEEARHLEEAIRQVPGNWLGGAPLRDGSELDVVRDSGRSWAGAGVRGSGVFQMFARRECLDMMSRYESEIRSGRRYKHVVVTRSDLHWVMPHPTVEQLESLYNDAENDRIWIADTKGDDWGGLYDRHFIAPRWLSSAGILNDWDIVLSGLATSLFQGYEQRGGPKNGQTKKHKTGVNSEQWLASRLQFAQIHAQRFPALAYVTCRPGAWHQQFHSYAITAKHCYSAGFPFTEQGFRFPREHEAATEVAACVEQNQSPPATGWSNGSFWGSSNLIWLRKCSQKFEASKSHS
ncbi:unnamed protein product [Polarella glacialis]|uniref:Uncharacterized protein n=1 Tax=Polarella glacialis TaxID=89957 RepID=A0A813F9P6_POLGL|nr:unnamed protein product [Polarella glacialis]CAE8735396.1 unnamed protein product [Polarella glacialis]